MRKLTQEEFVERCIKVHGDRYDYSSTIYVNQRTIVDVRCKIHGMFQQNAGDHIAGHGCPMCKCEKLKQNVFGVATNDMIGFKKTLSWRKWMSMLTRCYGVGVASKHPSYSGCTVCEEWLKFSNFKAWFDENYIDGYQLDKDILVKGNKIYSPATCCFVPAEINTIMLDRRRDRGSYPVGVSKQGNKYQANMNNRGHHLYIGLFDTPEEAFTAYKETKERHIKTIATEYYSSGEITKRVYDALMRWEVEITD